MIFYSIIIGQVSGYNAASATSRNFAGASDAFMVKGADDATSPTNQAIYVSGFGIFGFNASTVTPANLGLSQRCKTGLNCPACLPIIS